MTTTDDPNDRLAALCDDGALRIVYVLGVARSNSTIVCKVLGDRLDGSVYEPATPAAIDRRRHFARTILKAYDQARPGKDAGQPVVLAIKDLSLFTDDETLDFILDHAGHVVFTIRDPLTQYPSLVRQFKTEFGLRNRVHALLRWPRETMTLGYYSLVLGGGYLAEAIRCFGYSPTRTLLLPIAGWNLESWDRITRQFDAAKARLGPARVSVLDAGLMRLLPEAAGALLDRIGARALGDGSRTDTPADLAAHSRMFPGSAWAGEARQSDAIKPLSGTDGPMRPRDAFEEQLVEATYPGYGRLFFDSSNRLLPEARAHAGEPGAAQFRHLLETGSAAEALAQIVGGRAEVSRDWQAEPRAAAE